MDHEMRTNFAKIYDRYAQDRDKRGITSWKIQERDRFLALLKEEQKKILLENNGVRLKYSSIFIKKRVMRVRS